MPRDNNPTINTYNKIAQHYLERRKDRSPIEHHLARFFEMAIGEDLLDRPVIDIGCGPGFDTAAMREAGLNGIGLDLSWSMLEMGMRHYPGPFVLADMINLPMQANIGGLWCCASLLHLPRSAVPAALTEFARVLVPGGLLYLSVKEGVGEKWAQATDGQPGPRLFTYWQSSDLDSAIEAAGFQIVCSSAESSSQDTVWLARFALRS